MYWMDIICVVKEKKKKREISNVYYCEILCIMYEVLYKQISVQRFIRKQAEYENPMIVFIYEMLLKVYNNTSFNIPTNVHNQDISKRAFIKFNRAERYGI